MSEHNEKFTVKSARKLDDEYTLLIEDSESKQYMGYISKKSISVVSIDCDDENHKDIIKFLKEFKEICQD